MKESTKYYYRFTNGGNPHETVEARGNYREIVMSLAKWLMKVSLNGVITIKIGRDAAFAVREPETDSFDELSQMLDEVLSAGSEGVNND